MSRVAPERLRQSIRDARAENLLILYIDSYRSDNRQTQFYKPRHVQGRRDAYPRSFLRKPRNRQLIRQEFEGAVQWLASQSRWKALHWLFETFPSRYLKDAPQTPIEELKSIVQHVTRGIRVGDHTGWDEVRRVPARERQQRELRAEATNLIRSSLRKASGERAWRIVYNTNIARGFGGHVDALHPNWADALVRFVRTINELRQGRKPSRSGPIPGAPVTITAYMVQAATQTWNQRLTDAHRSVLAEQQSWREALTPIWQEVKARLTWGIQHADSIYDADSFDNGRYRYPPQDL